MPDGVWIEFKEVNVDDGRRTKVWSVINFDGSECLGRIGWYAPWRRYAYVHKAVAAGDQVILDCGCLRKIADFCEQQTELRKRERKWETSKDRDTTARPT